MSYQETVRHISPTSILTQEVGLNFFDMGTGTTLSDTSTPLLWLRSDFASFNEPILANNGGVEYKATRMRLLVVTDTQVPPTGALTVHLNCATLPILDHREIW